MRQIVLDTETTGLEASEGHRIIEIGCVELVHRRLTDNRYHQYLQPDREIDEGAMEVHGITPEFLKDKPRFESIAEDLLAYLDGAELIIHNAPFDVGFLDAEYRRLDARWKGIDQYCRILDTLVLARQFHPGQKNNLDALCKRYHVDNTNRTLHGALLDAEILSDVYLNMTGGQVNLSLDSQYDVPGARRETLQQVRKDRPALRVIHASSPELEAHQARLDEIEKLSGDKALWHQLELVGPEGEPV